MAEHNVNESCEKAHVRFDKHIDDMTNPKDGVLECMKKKFNSSLTRVYDKVDKKISTKICLWLMGTVITVVIIVVGATITYSVNISDVNREEHKQFVTKEDLKQQMDDVKQNFSDKMQNLENRIEDKLDRNQKAIIDAIKDNR